MAGVSEVEVTIEEENSVNTIWQGYTQDTTFHGVRFITSDSSSIFRRVFWSVSVIAAFGYLGYLIQDRFIYFLSDPVLVTVDRRFNATLQFPTVVICNQNSFKLTAAVADKSDQFISTFTNEGGKYEDLIKYTHNIHSENRGLHTANNVTLELALNRTMDYFYQELGHKAEDMIARCLWRNKPCRRDFLPIVTDHGLCYKFEGIQNETEEFVSHAAGSMEGLRLLVNIEQYEYTDGPHPAAGVKLLLTDRNDVHMITTLADGIGPGTHTFVGVDVLKSSRLSRPKSVCTEGKHLVHFNNYTNHGCREDCLARAYVKRCGCRKSSRWGNEAYPLCTAREWMQCENKPPLPDEKVTCNCEALCNTVSYTPVFSALKMSDMDHKSMDEVYWDRIQRNYKKALDIRVTLDEAIYTRYITAIKEFKETALASRDVYGKASFGELDDMTRRIFRLLPQRSREVLMNVTPYVNELGRFFEKFFVGPAEYLFPPIMEDGRALVSDIDEGFEKAKTDDGKKNELVDKVNRMIQAIRDSKVALNEIIVAYQEGRPLLNVSIKDELSQYFGIYPKEFVTKAVKRRSMVPYNATADAVIDRLNVVLNILNERPALDVSRFKERKGDLLQWMYKLGSNRLDLFNLIIKRPPEIALQFLSTQIRRSNSAEYRYVLLKQVRVFLWKWYDKGEYDSLKDYENWVNGLVDSGRIDLTYTATELLSHPNISQSVYKIRALFVEAFSRFKTAVDDNNILMDTLTYFLDNLQRSLYNISDRDTVAFTQLRTKLGLTWYSNEFVQVMKRNMTAFISRKREELWKVYDKLVPRFEKLSLMLKEYNNSLEINGEFYRKNYAEIDIYFQQMAYLDVSEQPTYDGAALLSDIGGSMGLLIGGSCLTVFEILDTIACCFKLLIARKKGKANIG